MLESEIKAARVHYRPLALDSRVDFFLGLRTSTRALVYEAVVACTRVHFKNSVTREVLYYRSRNQTLV